ncbi:MAG: chorismate synthase [Alphaproteobacteria bacterium]|nr:chorismate synthase [Alphaproteobacteria bacterium]MBO4644519.1 chorismate synthase [Alphaproteobacteria bacterium]
MTGNGFGEIFRVTTFGESHGPAIGCIVEGVPAQIPLDVSEIQTALDRRRPGQSDFTTQRKESDKVQILSGVFNGRTTGTPIGLLILNEDHHSADYAQIADKFRPGHADLPYFLKYGNRDYRGGGRASARETAMRVAAGVLAQKVLNRFIKTPFDITAGLIQVGKEKIETWDNAEINKNPLFCPDPLAVPRFEKVIRNARENKDSVGAVIEIRACGFPAGLGEPVYDRLDADLAKALMSINAVKGVEIGDGFDVTGLTGTQNADEFFADPTAPNGIGFKSNHAGGILGGLSTGQPIIARIAVKPTPSVASELQTVTAEKENTTVCTVGRHDPCVGIRAVPVAEAMTACVLADHLLRLRAQYA